MCCSTCLVPPTPSLSPSPFTLYLGKQPGSKCTHPLSWVSLGSWRGKLFRSHAVKSRQFGDSEGTKQPPAVLVSVCTDGIKCAEQGEENLRAQSKTELSRCSNNLLLSVVDRPKITSVLHLAELPPCSSRTKSRALCCKKRGENLLCLPALAAPGTVNPSLRSLFSPNGRSKLLSAARPQGIHEKCLLQPQQPPANLN